jgi:hypothetical protein
MRRALAFAFIVLGACRRDPSGRAATTESTTMPPAPPEPPTFPDATTEQLARKARSEARLGHEGIGTCQRG